MVRFLWFASDAFGALHLREGVQMTYPIGAKYLTHEETRRELRDMRAELESRRPHARGFAAWATRLDALTMALAALDAADQMGVGIDP